MKKLTSIVTIILTLSMFTQAVAQQPCQPASRPVYYNYPSSSRYPTPYQECRRAPCKTSRGCCDWITKADIAAIATVAAIVAIFIIIANGRPRPNNR